MTAFSILTVLPAAQLANLNELGYLSMTPVQAAALPAILAGKDLRGYAPADCLPFNTRIHCDRF
ncbi:hypothetical protein CKQ90_31675, partial [Klebsiella pneumoniae]